MNVSDLVAKLTKLQIEQDDIIQQLTDRAKDTEAETEDKKPAAQEADTKIHKGDHVLLLTGGVLCSKGDRARITKVTKSNVHLSCSVITITRTRNTRTFKKYHTHEQRCRNIRGREATSRSAHPGSVTICTQDSRNRNSRNQH